MEARLDNAISTTLPQFYLLGIEFVWWVLEVSDNEEKANKFKKCRDT